MGKSERVGEIHKIKCGHSVQIIEYFNANNITLEVLETGEIIKHRKYGELKRGKIKSNFYPSVCGKGFIGSGVPSVNGIRQKSYSAWKDMLTRCYKTFEGKFNQTYREAYVCEEWLDLGNFQKWYDENYYEIEDEMMCLDKDILVKGNKMYSPKTCIFVPKGINSLFVNCKDKRGDLPLGVYYNNNGKISARVHNKLTNKHESLGIFDTVEEAFN